MSFFMGVTGCLTGVRTYIKQDDRRICFVATAVLSHMCAYNNKVKFLRFLHWHIQNRIRQMGQVRH